MGAPCVVDAATKSAKTPVIVGIGSVRAQGGRFGRAASLTKRCSPYVREASRTPRSPGAPASGEQSMLTPPFSEPSDNDKGTSGCISFSVRSCASISWRLAFGPATRPILSRWNVGWSP